MLPVSSGENANYQSQQEVIDYLTANGFGEETWGDWFPDSSSAAADFATLSGLADENIAMPADLAINPHLMFASQHHIIHEAQSAEFFG